MAFNSMGFSGISWDFMGCNLMGFNGISLDLIEWDFMGFLMGFFWMLMGFWCEYNRTGDLLEVSWHNLGVCNGNHGKWLT